ncbi:hypothetical protein PTSG_10405, partial [Salpingoeca rosetta]
MQQQQQRMHHHHLLLNTSPNQPTSQPTNQPTHRPLLLLAEAGCLLLVTGGDSTSCIFGWKQQQRPCTLTGSKMREMSRILVTHASCTRLTHGGEVPAHIRMLVEAGSHAGCCCCNFPDSAVAVVLMQCSHMSARQGERLPEDRWRMMMGGAHMMEWEEQLWARTSMVMVGTSNHSDAVISAVTIIAIIAIDCTAAITLRPTPAPIRREADIAHVTRSDEDVSNAREAHEAVEPTTMTMTSAEGPCIPSPSNRPTKQPSERAKDTAWQGAQQLMAGCIVDELALCLSSISCSSSSSLVTNSSGCGHGCGGCDVRLCAVASHDVDDDGGRRPFSSQVLMTRPGRYTHAHTNVPEKKAP